jgi:aspartate carbamoyltransferase catalytic subunit
LGSLLVIEDQCSYKMAAADTEAALGLLAAGLIDGHHTSWAGKSIVSVDQFTKEGLDLFFKRTRDMCSAVTQQGGMDVLTGRILANIVFEPSTHSSCSFAAAMQRLGGNVLQINEVESNSGISASLEDTVRCQECFADFLVVRHPQNGAARQAAVAASKPVINAGDGTGENPTQALVDIFTIISELQHLDGLTLTIIGELAVIR